MSRANAALAPIQRLRIGKLIIDEGWPVAHAAVFFRVSWPTAKRWAERYAAMGRMATRAFEEVAFHPITATTPVAPSTIVLTDDSAAVLPDALADSLEREGWTIRRFAGVHHDMHLEDPDRTFALLVDLFAHTP